MIPAALERIAADLARPALRSGLDGSLGSGLTGLAVFYHYLAMAWPGAGWAAERDACLEAAAARLALEAPWPGLFSGLPGLAWATTHMHGTSTGPDPCEDIDEAVLRFLSRPRRDRPFDLIQGVVGLGVYGLERLRYPSGPAIVRAALARLHEGKEDLPEGCAWRTGPALLTASQRGRWPDGLFDLGLAHGVPGVIAFLGKAWARGIGRDLALPMLEGAMAWMLARRLPPGGACAFRAQQGPGPPAPDPAPSRMAWCYGDLGVGMALLSAARDLGRPDWEDAAVEVLEGAALRPREASGCVDGFLCHGSAGNAHLFGRAFAATRKPCFQAQAEQWLAWNVGNSRRDGPDRTDPPGLMDGAAGIGLALLSALGAGGPWDRVLLTDLGQP